MNDAAKSPPSVGDLLGSLVTETGTLVRQELHLASAEMGQKGKRAVLEVSTMLMGGALVHAGLLALIFGGVLALAAFVPMWMSGLAIGVVAMVVGYTVVGRALKALRELDPVPQRTVATLQQGKAFMKEQFR
jgi:hypothetical protein